MTETTFRHDLWVIRGCGGHVGLPFALICADSGLRPCGRAVITPA